MTSINEPALRTLAKQAIRDHGEYRNHDGEKFDLAVAVLTLLDERAVKTTISASSERRDGASGVIIEQDSVAVLR